jgi:hypothetical protein
VNSGPGSAVKQRLKGGHRLARGKAFESLRTQTTRVVPARDSRRPGREQGGGEPLDEAGIRGRGRSSQEANLLQIGSPLGDLVAGEAHQVEDLRSIVRCLRRVVLDPDKGRAQVTDAPSFEHNSEQITTGASISSSGM